MTFLPIVERELRVVSRRKGTYWMRSGAALAGLFFLLPALAIATMENGKSAVGATVFTWMSWYGAVACLLAGAFLGADCIAEERREGTLGFLFLTDLKTYDVVLGKFFGASLNAFYGLLAMLPVLGLSVLAGGVTGGEFWRMSLALVNMLFFSTALAILISARSKSNSPPTMIALGLVTAIWILGATLYYFSNTLSQSAAARTFYWLSMANPGEAFSMATAGSYLFHSAEFWRALAISNLIGWLCLGLAAWRLDASVIADSGSNSDYFGRRRRIPSLLAVNPIAWLLDDSRRLRNAVWTLGMGGALGCVALVAVSTFGVYGLWLSCFFLKILFAIQSCRFFAEGRRNGALELLGATPLSGKEMITGQWAALRRIFLVPVCLVFAANILACVWAISVAPLEAIATGVITLYQILTQALDFLAIGWCGMWIALTLRKPSRAVWITILVTILLPLTLFCVPNIAFDLIALAIAQNRISEWLNPRLRAWRDESRDQRTMIRS